MTMMNFTIAEIVKACNGTLVMDKVPQDQKVSGVVLDSRKVSEGGVFVATVGERVDGHSFIPDVYGKGIALVIAEKNPEQVCEEYGFNTESWGSYLLVENCFQALKDMAEAYRLKFDIPIVGITGSAGKTSTKECVASVLSEKYNVLKTEGNFNNEVGVPLTLLSLREEHTAAVVEMGISNFGEMHRLSQMVRPSICVLTNIGQCHLENLKTRDGILQAKTEIFDFMQEDGEVVLNGDDDKLATITDVKGKKPHFFGLGQNDNEEVMAKAIISKGLWGCEAFLAKVGEDGTEEAFQVSVPLPGAHMVNNAACSATVGMIMGLTTGEIAAGIAKVSPSSGRGKLIKAGWYTLIDDCYNANPVSMMAAIDLLTHADNQKVAILGDMFELGENSNQMHADLGKYAVESGIDRVICVGKSSRFMYDSAVEHAMEGQRVTYYEDRESLEADLRIPEGLLGFEATVLIKASHGMHFEKLIQILTMEDVAH